MNAQTGLCGVTCFLFKGSREITTLDQHNYSSSSWRRSFYFYEFLPSSLSLSLLPLLWFLYWVNNMISSVLLCVVVMVLCHKCEFQNPPIARPSVSPKERNADKGRTHTRRCAPSRTLTSNINFSESITGRRWTQLHFPSARRPPHLRSPGGVEGGVSVDRMRQNDW